MKTLFFRIPIFLVLVFSLISCESFLRFSGHVYDSDNKPIPNAKISLLINKRSIEKIGSEIDSISTESRDLLRKSGIKDDLHFSTEGQYINYKTLYTDENGYFKSQTILIGCGFGCPKVRLVTEKNDLKKITLMDRTSKRDSLRIILD